MSDDKSRYRMVPLFSARLAGGAFEELLRLATPETSRAVRRILALENEVDRARQSALTALDAPKQPLDRKEARRARRAIVTGSDLLEASLRACPELAALQAAQRAVETAVQELEPVLEAELNTTRRSLLASAATTLRRQSLFSSESMSRQMTSAAPDGALQARTRFDRHHEQAFLLYLQRACAKNDTVSEFGPTTWGRVVSDEEGAQIRARPGIGRRVAFLQKWVIETVAAAISADPEARLELAPRVASWGRIVGDVFVDERSGAETPLDEASVALAHRCDGRTPAHRFGDTAATLARLVELGVVVWDLRPQVYDARCMESLVDGVRAWRPGAVRDRWLALLDELQALPRDFVATDDLEGRRALLMTARERAVALGGRPTEGTRLLYASSNAIGENCHRECDIAVTESMVATLLDGAGPWLDLWRDNYAFCASRVAARLRALVETAPRHRGHLTLTAFQAHSESQGLPPLHAGGLARLGDEAFAETIAAWHELTAERPDAAEWTLTDEDCGFVRRRFAFHRFDAFTYPSGDLQIAATDVDAIARGEYQWLIAELHNLDVATQNAIFWSCPDPQVLLAAMQRMSANEPTFFVGGGFDRTMQTTLHPPLRPDQMTLVSPTPGPPAMPYVPPAEVEVHVTDDGDVRLRSLATGVDLGSMARLRSISFGFHPFILPRLPHCPRLLVGKVVVQRETWVVRLEELEGGPFNGTSPALVLAVERLRVRRGWPRWVFVRPSTAPAGRALPSARDKDVKPIYIDLESYLFVETFYRWLVKHEELEVAEMLPTPEQIPWREADGRRSFELRTLFTPA